MRVYALMTTHWSTNALESILSCHHLHINRIMKIVRGSVFSSLADQSAVGWQTFHLDLSVENESKD